MSNNEFTNPHLSNAFAAHNARNGQPNAQQAAASQRPAPTGASTMQKSTASSKPSSCSCHK